MACKNESKAMERKEHQGSKKSEKNEKECCGKKSCGTPKKKK